MLMATRTGHLGPTVFRSTDFGKTWKEAKIPPAFPKAPEGQNGRVVDHVCLAHPWTSRVNRASGMPAPHHRDSSAPTTAASRGAFFVHQRRSAIPRVDGYRAGRDTGWPQASFDPHRPTRSRPPLLRHVWGWCTNRWTAAEPGHPSSGDSKWSKDLTQLRSPSTTPLRPALSDRSRPVVSTEPLRNLQDGSL